MSGPDFILCRASLSAQRTLRPVRSSLSLSGCGLIRDDRRWNLLGNVQRNSFGEPQRKLTAGDTVVVFFISTNDTLHQAVADHVTLIELHERNAFNSLQDFHGVEQPGTAS